MANSLLDGYKIGIQSTTAKSSLHEHPTVLRKLKGYYLVAACSLPLRHGLSSGDRQFTQSVCDLMQQKEAQNFPFN